VYLKNWSTTWLFAVAASHKYVALLFIECIINTLFGLNAS
jgi:hypothetical protein